MITNSGTYTHYPVLADLPRLVRKQRKLERLIAPIVPTVVDQEKALRKEIDALLLEAGLAKGDCVTCNGYDVTHRERKGQTSLNETKLVELLVAGGVDRDFAAAQVLAAQETGDPAKWAEVEPSKGASVRK